jgi:hypothetical protein
MIGLNVVVSKLGNVEKVMSLGRELAQENSEEGEGTSERIVAALKMFINANVRSHPQTVKRLK